MWSAGKIIFLKHIDPKFPHEEFTARTRVVFREIVDSEGLAVKPGAKRADYAWKRKGISFLLWRHPPEEIMLPDFKRSKGV